MRLSLAAFWRFALRRSRILRKWLFSSRTASGVVSKRRAGIRLGVEQLELREVPSVTFPANPDVPYVDVNFKEITYFNVKNGHETMLSSSLTGTAACKMIGPASRFSSTKWTVQPANLTP